jgi:transmembrane sensor
MRDHPPIDLDVLRKDVADVERSVVDWDKELRSARARFLLTAKGHRGGQHPKRRRAVLTRTAFALAASIALAVGGWATYHRQHAPISFRAGTEAAEGQVGDLLYSPGSEPLPVHFSDGTFVSMGASTRARVTETNSHGATVVLAEGSLSLAVVHRAASRWNVAAGPFTVLVTGTKFDVHWNAAEETLALDLHEGSVTVIGPSLGPAGRRVLAGESIRVSVPSARAAATPNAPFAAPAEMADVPSARGDRAKDDRARAVAVETNGAGRGSWRQLALDGLYADALAVAEAEGFETTCRRASTADLLLLGYTARFAGSLKRAEQALQLVQSRPLAGHEAAMSAFTLGRIAYDDRRNYADAARWFRSYLRDEPSGGLAREAAGRLIEAQKAAGDVAAARESASAYLSKYPVGPHAALARAVLNP